MRSILSSKGTGYGMVGSSLNQLHYETEQDSSIVKGKIHYQGLDGKAYHHTNCILDAVSLDIICGG